jgi:DNA-binding response OmpR family regulator
MGNFTHPTLPDATASTANPVSFAYRAKSAKIQPFAAPLMDGSQKTILVVEDDHALREMVERLLKKEGFRVLSATDGGEAAEIIATEKETIDLLLADILLPGLSGPEIARELRAQNPNLKVIFASGSHSGNVLDTIEFVEQPIFVPKPYDPKTLLAAIRLSLG